jgi:predicted nucleic acid-binding protein
MIDAIRIADAVYFDTAPLIYFIEDNPEFADLLSPIIQAIDTGEKLGLSSYVTLIEVLVQPLRQSRPELAQEYRNELVGRASFRLCALDQRVAEEAARIRAVYRFKVPDAIQLATANVHGADVFVTNDGDLRRFPELPVVVLHDYARPG